MKTTIVVTVMLTVLVGCAKKPTAMEACKKLEIAGVASGCHESKPEGLGSAAVERAEFSLPTVPDKGGSVYRFDKEDTYTSTVTAFEKVAMLAGPHRYGSAKTLLFLQMNEGASLEVGKRAKAVMDALPGDSAGPPVSTVVAPTPKAAEPAAAAASSATPATVAAGASAVDTKGVCVKLVAAGVAKNCTGKAEPGPLERLTFDLVTPAGRTGNIVHATDGGFAKYEGMVNALPPTSALRPFVLSEKAAVVVHLPTGTAPGVLAKAKAVVDAL